MSLCGSLCSGSFGDYFVWLCRLWGLATIMGLWGIGVETSHYGHYLGYYLLAVAVLLTFLEVVFGINYCVMVCMSVDSLCKSCWDCILWLDDWKKGIFYFVLSIPCFIQPIDVWLAIIAGTMLILSGIFYMLKTFKTRVENERIKLAQNPSYDKFDDIQEDIDDDDDDDDDNVITHHGTMTITMDDDIGDQQEILEV